MERGKVGREQCVVERIEAWKGAEGWIGRCGLIVRWVVVGKWIGIGGEERIGKVG